MTVVDMEVIRGEKKDPCPYCGEEEHKVPLACPRINGITLWGDPASPEAIDIHFIVAGADAAG